MPPGAPPGAGERGGPAPSAPPLPSRCGRAQPRGRAASRGGGGNTEPRSPTPLGPPPRPPLRPQLPGSSSSFSGRFRRRRRHDEEIFSPPSDPRSFSLFFFFLNNFQPGRRGRKRGNTQRTPPPAAAYRAVSAQHRPTAAPVPGGGEGRRRLRGQGVPRRRGRAGQREEAEGLGACSAPTCPGGADVCVDEGEADDSGWCGGMCRPGWCLCGLHWEHPVGEGLGA